MLGVVAEGSVSAEIAERLVVRQATLKGHANDVFGEAGIGDRARK